MILYNCSYIPVEFLMASKIPYKRVESKKSVVNGELHNNLCSFCLSTLPTKLSENDVLIWADSCDSMRRSCDVLRRYFSGRVLPLEIPNVSTKLSVERFAHTLSNFFTSFKKAIKREITLSELKKSHERLLFLIRSFNDAIRNNDLEKMASLCKTITGNDYIGSIRRARNNILIVGSPAPSSLIDVIEETGNSAINATCTGLVPCLGSPEDLNEEDIFLSIAKRILEREFHCMRFVTERDIGSLRKYFDFNGIILHTAKFCDFYGFEEKKLKALNLPFVHIETEPNHVSKEQIKTRLGALVERISEPEQVRSQKKRFCAGIDSGSTSTKLVVVDSEKRILFKKVVKTGAFPKKTALDLLSNAVSKIGCDKQEVYIIATGYGRGALNFADEAITEITCHAKGVSHLFPNICTIIDIGGQDSKVIKLENGSVKDFIMNDKCAAGTGRFLEVMSQILEIPLSSMGDFSLRAQNSLSISSVCTVFAESEVISLRSQGHSREDIVAGLHTAISRRITSMYERVNGKAPVAFTGGVALNKGLKVVLEKMLQTELLIPDDPEITGALGAALIGLEKSL
ncbi:MAG: CoA activase [Thermotogae bacterium]|nr:MAG: CoA activase [Thermotogota bacterium]